MFESYLLFFFAALGSFNGLALSFYLLCRRPITPAQRWLAALVLVLSVRTGKSVLFFFWPGIPALILQIGLTAYFLIGACLLGFVRAWADPERQHTRRDPIMVLGLLVLAIAFGITYPYSKNLSLWRGLVFHTIQIAWFVCLLIASWVFYLEVRRRALEPGNTNATIVATGFLTKTQVGSVIASVAVIWLAYATVGLTSYIVGALSFTILLYLSIMVALAQRARALPISASPKPAAEPYQDRKIDPSEAEEALDSLHKLMANERLYESAELTLSKVARRLNVPPARLSQLLNDNHKTTFKQYLAQLRIEAAKKRLLETVPVSMEQIAEASGFLSMSTFYSSFKKVEGTTPAAWRQAQLLDANS